MPSAVSTTMPAPAPSLGLTNTGFRLGDDMHFSESEESESDQSAASDPDQRAGAQAPRIGKVQRRKTRRAVGEVVEQMEGIVGAFHTPESKEPEPLAITAKGAVGNQKAMNKRTRQNLAKRQAREKQKMGGMDVDRPAKVPERHLKPGGRRDINRRAREAINAAHAQGPAAVAAARIDRAASRALCKAENAAAEAERAAAKTQGPTQDPARWRREAYNAVLRARDAAVKAERVALRATPGPGGAAGQANVQEVSHGGPAPFQFLLRVRAAAQRAEDAYTAAQQAPPATAPVPEHHENIMNVD